MEEGEDSNEGSGDGNEAYEEDEAEVRATHTHTHCINPSHASSERFPALTHSVFPPSGFSCIPPRVVTSCPDSCVFRCYRVTEDESLSER